MNQQLSSMTTAAAAGATPSAAMAGAAGAAPPAPVRVRLPATVRGAEVIAGGKLQAEDPAREFAWITPLPGATGRDPVVVEYDFPLPGPAAERTDRRAPLARAGLVRHRGGQL